MDETCGIKKEAVDKLVFLGFLILALLIAYFITVSKSTMVSSGPITLNYSGLSLSVPIGNGWQSEKEWNYKNNIFTLSSVFYPESDKPAALAHCRYLLAGPDTSKDAQFEKKAAEISGIIDKTGKNQLGSLTMDWAYIKNPKTLSDLFLGIIQLPNNRWLDIEVHQAAGDTHLSRQAFELITESLRFEDNQLLSAGSEIVAEIKSTGLDGLLSKENPRVFFLIQDTKQQTIGFTMDVLLDLSGQDNNLNIQAAGFLYVPGQLGHEQATLFQGTSNLDEFAWKSETRKRSNSSGTELVLKKTGLMTVRDFNLENKEETYQLNAAAIPDVFLELISGRMLISSYEKIVLDLIEADGTITPVFISKISGQENKNYLLRMELLNRKGFFEQIYLDSDMRIYKRLLQQEGAYVLKRADSDDILREFPERADYILQKNKMLK